MNNGHAPQHITYISKASPKSEWKAIKNFSESIHWLNCDCFGIYVGCQFLLHVSLCVGADPQFHFHWTIKICLITIIQVSNLLQHSSIKSASSLFSKICIIFFPTKDGGNLFKWFLWSFYVRSGIQCYVRAQTSTFIHGCRMEFFRIDKIIVERWRWKLNVVFASIGAWMMAIHSSLHIAHSRSQSNAGETTYQIILLRCSQCRIWQGYVLCAMCPCAVYLNGVREREWSASTLLYLAAR